MLDVIALVVAVTAILHLVKVVVSIIGVQAVAGVGGRGKEEADSVQDKIDYTKAGLYWDNVDATIDELLELPLVAPAPPSAPPVPQPETERTPTRGGLAQLP